MYTWSCWLVAVALERDDLVVTGIDHVDVARAVDPTAADRARSPGPIPEPPIA
jgi:hypothetical protein